MLGIRNEPFQFLKAAQSAFMRFLIIWIVVLRQRKDQRLYKALRSGRIESLLSVPSDDRGS